MNTFVRSSGDIKEKWCPFVRRIRYTISMYRDAEKSGGGINEKTVVMTKGGRVHSGVWWADATRAAAPMVSPARF